MVSIIVPIYNTGKYLNACLQSIRNQSFVDFEVIMIDDGSTDSSLQIAKEFEEADQRFHVYSQLNAGVSAARNRGLEAASGEFVLFVDSDDRIELTMIEILLHDLQSSNADIACCQFDRANSFHGAATEVWNREKFLKEFLIHKRINGSLVNKLFRRMTIGDNRLDISVKYGEDALFLWKVLLGAETICISPKALYHITLHDDSASGGGSYKPIRIDCIKVWKEVCRDAEFIGEPYFEIAKAQLGNMAFFSIYQMAYYDYRDTEQTVIFCNALRECLPSMKKSDFIGKQEILLSEVILHAPLFGCVLVKLRKELRKRA